MPLPGEESSNVCCVHRQALWLHAKLPLCFSSETMDSLSHAPNDVLARIAALLLPRER
jgi:hypothetical protein